VTEPSAGPGRLRVLTYNLRDLKDDGSAVARVIRAVRPDVACLQEVPRHPFSGHRIGQLADSCQLLWPGGASSASGGTVILTSMRVDQRAAQSGRLPVSGTFTRGRGYAAAVLALPGGPSVTVASVHLGLQSQERERHAQLLLDQIRAFGPAPYVVAGDLNEPPGSPAWRVLEGAVRDAAARAEVSVGTTAATAPTYPARAPRRRIDAVLVSPGLVVHSVRVVGPDDGVAAADLLAASDHLPVIADLELAAPETGS
jgi:endonuclease/exonuclease/phosphatase family metal-dependent hydrolase